VRSGQALVVGASSEIGRAVAVMLAQEGHDLALWGRDRTRLLSAVREVEALGQRCSLATVDVTDYEALREQLAHVLGSGRVRLGAGRRGRPAHLRAGAGRDLTTAVVLTALVLPALVQVAPSVLVFIGSGASRLAFPSNAAYVTSKHGLPGLANATSATAGSRSSSGPSAWWPAGAVLLSPTGNTANRTRCAKATSRRPSASSSPFLRPAAPVEIELQPQRSHGRSSPRTTSVRWAPPYAGWVIASVLSVEWWEQHRLDVIVADVRWYLDVRAGARRTTRGTCPARSSSSWTAGSAVPAARPKAGTR